MYKCLTNQTYTIEKFSIVPIRYQDRLNIMKWRNEQIYHLRQEALLKETEQEDYFQKVIASYFSDIQPKNILFSFLLDSDCVGYGGLVHVNWKDKHSEVSFLMNTEHEKLFFYKYWTKFLKLIEQVAFNDLQLHKIFTYAFDVRPHLYPILENCNFKCEAKLIDHVLLENKFVDVIIHSKLNSSTDHILRAGSFEDADLLFEWANDEIVRSNSFNQNEILYEDHIKWLKMKLESKNSVFFIFEQNHFPVGQIRLDKLNPTEMLINYSISKEHRGRGIGITLILQTIKEVREAFPEVKRLVGYVKKDNLASIRIFEKTNFFKNFDIQKGCYKFTFNL